MPLFLEESILRGTQWAAFEPNDEHLWAKIRRAIDSFLAALFRQGAFAGGTLRDASLVKCDGETNPADVIDRGQMVVEIGVAPAQPAEFIIFSVVQKMGDQTAAEA